MAVIATVVLLFASLFPNVHAVDARSGVQPHHRERVVESVHAQGDGRGAAAFMTPVVIIYQGWTYWVFRQRISSKQIPASIGLRFKEKTW